MSTLIKISRVKDVNVTLNVAFNEAPVINKEMPYFFINPGIWTDEGPVEEYPSEIGGPAESFYDDIANDVWNTPEKRADFLGGILESIHFVISHLANENQLHVLPPDGVTESTLESFIFYPETPQDISKVNTPWCLVEAVVDEEKDELEFRMTIGRYVGEVNPTAVATETVQQMAYFFSKIEGLLR